MFGFSGFIDLIFDPKIVCSIMQQDPMVKVISLDEDYEVPMLDDEKNPQVIAGTILLPPVEALWAVVDEQLDQFSQIYYAHLTTPECMQYIATLIAALYQGTRMIMWYPEEDNITIKYLYTYLQQNYGLTLGLNTMHPFMWDPMSIPLYCNSIFSVRAMSPYQYLEAYPIDATIPEQVYMDIINMGVPGDNMREKIEIIDTLKRVLKTNPKAVVPIREVEQ